MSMAVIQVAATTAEHEPIRKACSLLGECVVEPGGKRDYMLLSRYHYRNHAYPPAVHQIYRARHEPTGRTVGVIVYAAPALNLGIRNKVFGDRYKIGGRRKENRPAAKRLNSEVELIIRVIVHPTFRGVGLGVRLIKETMPLRGYPVIEMSAAMGAINPFGDRAGMRRFDMPRPPNTERALAALRSVGITQDQIGNPRRLLEAVQALPDSSRALIKDELLRYGTRWIKSRTTRKAVVTLEDACRGICANSMLKSVYYVWQREETDDPSAG